MRVRDIIQSLQERYQPDDNLVVFWWDNSTFDIATEDELKVWDSVVDDIQEGFLPAEEQLGAVIGEMVFEKLEVLP
jgi:hypothetical protein